MKHKKILLPPLLLLAFITLAVVGTYIKRPTAAPVIACARPLQGCVFSHQGLSVQLRFLSLPTPMQPFQIEVRAPNAKHARAEIQMVGMDMGFNRYELHPSVQGTFTATITLPVCVSGRRDWNLYLAIDANTYVIPFSTQ